MNESDFEGSLILEQLARIDAVEAFMAAVDGEDIQSAVTLMRQANIDDKNIEIVIKKIMDPYDEH